MKILLATTMALAVVTVLGSTQPANAIVIQPPTVTVSQQNHIVPAYWHRWHHWHRWHYWRHHWHHWRWGW
jgi:hypothetical protein